MNSKSRSSVKVHNKVKAAKRSTLTNQRVKSRRDLLIVDLSKFWRDICVLRRETLLVPPFHYERRAKDHTCIGAHGHNWTILTPRMVHQKTRGTIKSSLCLDTWRGWYCSSWKHRRPREMGNHASAHQPLERATSHAGNGLRFSVRCLCCFYVIVTFTYNYCACHIVTGICGMKRSCRPQITLDGYDYTYCSEYFTRIISNFMKIFPDNIPLNVNIFLFIEI